LEILGPRRLGIDIWERDVVLAMEWGRIGKFEVCSGSLHWEGFAEMSEVNVKKRGLRFWFFDVVGLWWSC